MSIGERLFNLALGLSILGWGATHFRDPSPVLITLGTLNVAVGLLILFRRAEETAPSWGQIGLALPAVLASGAALVLAPPPESWALGPTVLLGLGCAFTLFAFAYLGRSFAVLPSLRKVVARGPYAVVRHPAYAGELAMLGAVAWAIGWVGLAILAAATALVVLRIEAEEQVLRTSDRYVTYAQRVRHRLVPGLY